MVRAMRAMGVDYAAEYLQRFGFPAQNIVHTESLALGSASFTPMQLVRGYAVLANGGYLVDPYFITKIEDDNGNTVFEAKPKVVCGSCNLPVIYGDTHRSAVLSDDNIETSPPRRKATTARCRCLSWSKSPRLRYSRTATNSMRRTSSAHSWPSLSTTR